MFFTYINGFSHLIAHILAATVSELFSLFLQASFVHHYPMICLGLGGNPEIKTYRY